MVRKSELDEWRSRTREASRIAAARQAAEQLLALEGIEVPPDPAAVAVPIPADAYEVWLAVEIVKGRTHEAELGKALVREFGSKDACAEALAIALSVEKTLGSKEEATGRLARPTPIARGGVTVAPARNRPTPMQRRDVVLYSIKRARELGFTPEEVWAKGQGQRSTQRDTLKRVRAQIIVELRERHATLVDIGLVFGGRNKASISELESVGRAQLEEKKLVRYEEQYAASRRRQPKGDRDG